ncbi:DNA protecting protein DprA [Anaerobacillus alkalidiazotrophicus]|uniref:DNA protecting protein DprA n=2 Tax=Anaerobacillus alkalidiazotrophicus TaxID=472963 RepID=A0A1S2LZT8_9BACI|nr:DNA protecting protein DprA [Anaerobacillus alkalidiazotrophicus]
MCMSVRKRLIHLHSCKGVTWQTLNKFLQYDSSLEKIYQLNKEQLKQIFSLRNYQVESLYKDLHSRELVKRIEEFHQTDVRVVTIFDQTYPDLLKQIFDPPWVLYCKGDLSLFHAENKISVVGTRDPSKNGLLSLDKIVLPLIKENWVIVSGLAVGIDARAHALTLHGKGKTIAVLGSGFNYIYPRCHQKLASIISKEHLLISEFPPSHPPQKWNFPMRNRIISGLSKGTLIIEARERSGSLITADLALQQGREVFAVPGSILDERSEGAHWLIQQGAKLTKCSNDVLNEW